MIRSDSIWEKGEITAGTDKLGYIIGLVGISATSAALVGGEVFDSQLVQETKPVSHVGEIGLSSWRHQQRKHGLVHLTHIAA